MDADGYGKLKDRRRHVRAPRIAYQLATGVDPGGNFVLHSCDTPRCVNPSHLSLGSGLENMRQRSARARAPRGDSHACIKVTNAQVVEIRTKIAAGLHPREIAPDYGIHHETVRRIGAGVARPAALEVQP